MWTQPRPEKAEGLDPQILQEAGLVVLLVVCAYLWLRFSRWRRCASLPAYCQGIGKCSGCSICCLGIGKCSGCTFCGSQQCPRGLGASAVDSLCALKDKAKRSVRFCLGAPSKSKCSTSSCQRSPCRSSPDCCSGTCSGCTYCKKKVKAKCSKSISRKIVDGIISSLSGETPTTESCSPCFSAPCGTSTSCLKSSQNCAPEKFMYEITITKGVMSTPCRTKIRC